MDVPETTARAEPKLPFTAVDWILLLAGLGSAATVIVLTITTWSSVPPELPPDLPGNWYNRDNPRELLIIPIIGLMAYLIISVLAAAPSTFDYGRKVTPENAPFLYRLGRRFVWPLRSSRFGSALGFISAWYAASRKPGFRLDRPQPLLHDRRFSLLRGK